MNSINKQIDYWKKSAGHNLKTATGLFQLKRYDSCLFFCHLVLEKLLKGLVTQNTQKPAPHIHDLERLSILARLELSKEQIKNLKMISKFNIAGRYDEIKFDFYKLATKLYAEKYLEISKNLILCLKKQYQKK